VSWLFGWFGPSIKRSVLKKAFCPATKGLFSPENVYHLLYLSTTKNRARLRMKIGYAVRHTDEKKLDWYVDGAQGCGVQASRVGNCIETLRR
jgi:hypothetical protein